LLALARYVALVGKVTGERRIGELTAGQSWAASALRAGDRDGGQRVGETERDLIALHLFQRNFEIVERRPDHGGEAGSFDTASLTKGRG
jgi:hypothetical protein